MNYREKNSEEVLPIIIIVVFFGIILVYIFEVIILKIKSATGLSSPTLESVGDYWFLFIIGIMGVKYFIKSPLLPLWNFILSAFWLTLIPALNQWGIFTFPPASSILSDGSSIVWAGETKTGLAWYAQAFWQYTIAALIASSKYIYRWIKDNFFN